MIVAFQILNDIEKKNNSNSSPKDGSKKDSEPSLLNTTGDDSVEMTEKSGGL
tara:strand:- start:126 stop:281 length:156 start_codon:yes stop_codon:yes gene_type:complete